MELKLQTVIMKFFHSWILENFSAMLQKMPCVMVLLFMWFLGPCQQLPHINVQNILTNT